MKYIKLFSVLLIAYTLQGCVAVSILGGVAAGVAATSVIYDKRSYTEIKKDHNISNIISSFINSNRKLANQCRVVVSTYNGSVLLAGQAPTEKLKRQIESIAQNVKEIKQLYNEIEVRPIINESVRVKDSWITTKIKSKLLANEGFQSGQISVTTENSVVYLQGIVSHSQGKQAAIIASSVNGVRKVVKLFEYTASK